MPQTITDRIKKRTGIGWEIGLPYLLLQPLILLVTCSLEVMIWSMSVRMEASREERAASHFCNNASYWVWHCPCTRLYTTSLIYTQETHIWRQKLMFFSVSQFKWSTLEPLHYLLFLFWAGHTKIIILAVSGVSQLCNSEKCLFFIICQQA